MRIFSIWLQARSGSGAARCRTTQMHRTIHTHCRRLLEGEREIELDTRLTNVGEGVGGGERACPDPHVSTTLNTDTGVASWRLIIAQAQRRFEDN